MEAKRSISQIKLQRRKVAYANTKMKTVVAAQLKYPNILENAPSSGQDAARAFLGRGLNITEAGTSATRLSLLWRPSTSITFFVS